MRRYILILAFLVAGCSDDPATSRLKVGQTAVIIDGNTPSKHHAAAIDAEHGENFPVGSPASQWPYLRNGDEVTVIADNSTENSERRGVIVHVEKFRKTSLDVDLTGLKCRLKRSDIRPID